MSESTRRIDARGLACPKPVLSAKKALEEGGFDRLEIVVDNAAARENVSRFARYSGNEVLSVSEEGGGITILIGVKAGAGAAASAADAAAASCADAEERSPAGKPGAATVFLRSARIGGASGGGDDELGALLMRAFLATLSETESAPRRLVLMNGGVRLAVRGAETVEALRKLESLGIEILACGTCLKFFKLEDKLAVGRVSNMYEIAGALLEGNTVTV